QVVARYARVKCRVVEPTEVNRHAQDPPHLVIEICLRDGSGLEQRNEDFLVVMNTERHLEIEAPLYGGGSVVSCDPIGHDDAGKVPLLFGHFNVKSAILRHMFAVGEI